MMNNITNTQLQIFIDETKIKYKHIGNLIVFDMTNNYHIKHSSKIILTFIADSIEEPINDIQMFGKRFTWNKSIGFVDNNIININDMKTIDVSTTKIDNISEL